MPGYRHDYLKFYQLPNSNLFTYCLLFFSREATSETYCPRVSFSYYWPLRSTFPLLLFLDLLNQKYKNTLLQFILIYFILCSRDPINHIFITSVCQFPALLPKRVDNPFYTSGCEYLLFVCRCYLRGVRRFSYLFDNLGLITKGNTYHR